ncbi:hypothetical protein ACFY64_18255 [Streptomyces collinus]|uniref:hypothetical protein n=1 Tax=Streptomyces collinus TaxID=42684 RepID=UPI0036C2CAC1
MERSLLGAGPQDHGDHLRERSDGGAAGDLGGRGDAAARRREGVGLGPRQRERGQQVRPGPAAGGEELGGLVGGQPVGERVELGGHTGRVA